MAAPTPFWIMRGTRDFYDVTPDEMQEAVDLLGQFYGVTADIISDMIHSEDDEDRRISEPALFAAYYETSANFEKLRKRILARKRREEQALANFPS